MFISRSGNIFSSSKEKGVHFIFVTTNKVVKKNGCLVMGKGMALQAAQICPALPSVFGRKDLFHYDKEKRVCYVNFSTKDNWADPSTNELILESIRRFNEEVVDFVEENQILVSEIRIPKAGCGLGSLDWREVKPLFLNNLDYQSRFTYVFYDL